MSENDEQGVDAVRAALARARAASLAKGLRPGSPGAAPRRRRRVPGEFSGAHPDARDPQPFSSAVGRLISELGWTEELAVGGVVGRWPDLVGPDIAEHAVPLTFENGVLTLQASSTTWATHLRLLAPKLLARIAEDLGDGIVTRLVIKPPSAPSWKHGRYQVGDARGPRDTYG